MPPYGNATEANAVPALLGPLSLPALLGTWGCPAPHVGVVRPPQWRAGIWYSSPSPPIDMQALDNGLPACAIPYLLPHLSATEPTPATQILLCIPHPPPPPPNLRQCIYFIWLQVIAAAASRLNLLLWTGRPKHLLPSPSSPITLEAMASLTAAAVSVPRFTGLRAAGAPASSSKVAAAPKHAGPLVSVRASLKELGAAVVATAASAILAGNALAFDVKLGDDDGGLAFVPSEFSVAAGEKIVFKNNAGFPHNVVFDEDEVPSGVNAAAISMNEEDLLNGPGEEYSVVLSEKGTYAFFCSPHQGAGMVGKVTVN